MIIHYLDGRTLEGKMIVFSGSCLVEVDGIHKVPLEEIDYIDDNKERS